MAKWGWPCRFGVYLSISPGHVAVGDAEGAFDLLFDGEGLLFGQVLVDQLPGLAVVGAQPDLVTDGPALPGHAFATAAVELLDAGYREGVIAEPGDRPVADGQDAVSRRG